MLKEIYQLQSSFYIQQFDTLTSSQQSIIASIFVAQAMSFVWGCLPVSIGDQNGTPLQITDMTINILLRQKGTQKAILVPYRLRAIKGGQDNKLEPAVTISTVDAEEETR
ncbi:MAG: hypothetical protein AAFV95_15015 [Bacteroidota bacterium]